MKRAWSIQRCFVAKNDGQTRWDQVYQQLLRWTTHPPNGGEVPGGGERGHQRLEGPDAHRVVWPRLRAHVEAEGSPADERNVFRDAGYSGATLNRPGLDQLRGRAALAEFDCVVVTARDRHARKYVHQVLLIEELEQRSCQVEFLERPMSQDPHDQLLLQIRWAVAEYERSLMRDRMRRGRLVKRWAGQLLPWSQPLFGYRLDPDHPRDSTGLHVEPVAAAVVRQMFAWYLEPHVTVHAVALRLMEAGVATPTGKPRCNVASVRPCCKTRPIPAQPA